MHSAGFGGYVLAGFLNRRDILYLHVKYDNPPIFFDQSDLFIG